MSTRTLIRLLALATGYGAMVAAADPADQFAFCPKATFADCTKALCKPLPGGSDYSCQCTIRHEYSATAAGPNACMPATSTSVQSRYHPTKSYQICADPGKDSPAWAWCLGVSCTIDKRSANCTCTAPPRGVDHFPYVITRDTYRESLCRPTPAGFIFSSAPPESVSCVTEFLQKHVKNLQPPKVLNGSTPVCPQAAAAKAP